MQQKKFIVNFIIFFILIIVIPIGWRQLEMWIWPPKPRPPEVWPWKRDATSPATFARLAGLSAPAGPGLDNAARLAAEVALADEHRDMRTPRKPEVAVEPWPWRGYPDYIQTGAFARLAGAAAGADASLGDAVRLATDLHLAIRRPDMAVRPAAQQVVLGDLMRTDDNDFNLRVVLSTLGGCVRQVILNKFQEADIMGLPEWEDRQRRVAAPLELLPEYRTIRTDQQKQYDLADPYYHYMLYHYAQPAEDRPLETLARRMWKVESIKNKLEDEVHEVVFSSPDDVPGLGVKIFKKYTLERRTYHVGLEIKVQNLRPEKQAFRYQLDGARGLPIDGEWYTTTYRNALVGWNENGRSYRNIEDIRQLSAWNGGQKLERGDSGSKVIRYAASAVQYFTSALVVDTAENQPSHRDDFLARVRATLETGATRGRIKKIDLDSFVLVAEREYTFDVPRSALALRDRLSMTRPNSEVVVVWRMRDTQLVATALRDSTTTNPMVIDDFTMRAVTAPIELQASGTPGDAVEHKYLIYNGPVKVRLLGYLEGNRAVPPALVERYEDQLSLNTLTDFHSPGMMGEFADSIKLTDLIIWCTNRMHALFWVLHTYVFPWSYGVCIILLTVMVRGLMFPISRRQAITSMQMQEKMAKLSPELKKIKEKYKDDFQALSQAQQELYRRHGINPFATLSGCLLLFAQMPVFLGLYYALQESIFLRLAPFFSWLPWIKNLAAPDMLFSWVPWDLALSQRIPYISTPDDQGSMIYLGPFFNLLPVVAVSFMVVQQKLMAPPPTDEQQEMQQKMMKYMMVFIGVMFYKVAAGLCVYFIASSLWGLAERKLNPRARLGLAGAGGPSPGGAGTPGSLPPSTPRPKAETRRARADGRKKKPRNATLQKMQDWWNDVLEQAKKKGR